MVYILKQIFMHMVHGLFSHTQFQENRSVHVQYYFKTIKVALTPEHLICCPIFPTIRRADRIFQNYFIVRSRQTTTVYRNNISLYIVLKSPLKFVKIIIIHRG